MPDSIECIGPRGGGLETIIKRDHDLDPYRILYEMQNEDMYLNILNEECRHLGKNNSVTYATKANEREGLCRGDVIYVTGRMSDARTRCRLGAFYRLE
ncbi:MAG: hypothetical protein ABL996_11010 [Micropepsaceae bacterium]